MEKYGSKEMDNCLNAYRYKKNSIQAFSAPTCDYSAHDYIFIFTFLSASRCLTFQLE